MFMIGNSEKLTSATDGSRVKSFGKSAIALSTASCVRCFAMGTVTSVLNSTMMTDTSCKAFDFTRFTPVIDLICFSIGLLIVFSMSEGVVPA